jgi:hypothetical protein
MSQSNPLPTHEPNQLAATRKRYWGFDWIKRNFPVAGFDVADGAAAIAAVIGTSTAAQAAKVSQKVAKYQDAPKGEQRYENRTLFEALLTCKNREAPNCCRARLVHQLCKESCIGRLRAPI